MPLSCGGKCTKVMSEVGIVEIGGGRGRGLTNAAAAIGKPWGAFGVGPWGPLRLPILLIPPALPIPPSFPNRLLLPRLPALPIPDRLPIVPICAGPPRLPKLPKLPTCHQRAPKRPKSTKETKARGWGGLGGVRGFGQTSKTG